MSRQLLEVESLALAMGDLRMLSLTEVVHVNAKVPRVAVPVVECVICVEPMNKSTRKAVPCEWCDFVACRVCCEHRVLDLPEPKCMNSQCGKPWSRKHMRAVFTGVFVDTRFKAHRAQLELDKEKALLPATQERLMVMKENAIVIDQLSRDRDEMSSMLLMLTAERSGLVQRWSGRMHRLKKSQSQENETELAFIARIPGLATEHAAFVAERQGLTDQMRELELDMNHLTARVHALRTGRVDPSDNSVRRRKALRACPGDTCRGFLDEDWMCGMCNMEVCASCRAPITGAHTCNKDDVASAKAIDKETRGCPKCATAIFKIDGCDQMWCTQCQTAFSWRTGAIETHVHNPHFFEWMRRTGGQARALGEVQCGREIDGMFMRELSAHGMRLCSTVSRNLEVACRTVSHIRLVELPDLQNRVNNDAARFNIRADFLENRVSEDVFRAKVLQRVDMDTRNREKAQVLDMLVHASTDILHRLLADLRAMQDVRVRSLRSSDAAILSSRRMDKEAVDCLREIERRTPGIRAVVGAAAARMEECETELMALQGHANECMAEIAKTFKCSSARPVKLW